MKVDMRFLILSVVVLALSSGSLPAQQAPSTQTTQSAASLPQGASEILATVIEVQGRAQHAPAGTEVTDTAAWQSVQLNDRYPGGTLIRTGLSSHVTLQCGDEQPYTVVMVERMTLANIASLYKTQTEKTGHVTVNYGAVRGGVTEGGLRSSFVVDSTVATLTKRGTWGFRLFVERGTGRYDISLAEQGIVDALNRLTHSHQTIVSGQYVTQAMRRWVLQATFDRTFVLQDRFGLTTDEFQAQALYGGGLSVLSPAPTPGVYLNARPGQQQAIGQHLRTIRDQQDIQQIQGLFSRPNVIDRPEGNFNSPF